MVCKLNRWPQIPVSTIDSMTLPRNHETKFRVTIIILSKFILYTNCQKCWTCRFEKSTTIILGLWGKPVSY